MRDTNKAFALAAVVMLSLGAAAALAGELDSAVLHGETDKARAIDYAPGEEMVFTISLQGAKEVPAGKYFVTWERTGDDGKKDSGKVPLSATKPLVVRTSLDRPGFVRVLAEVVDGKGKPYKKAYTGDTTTPEGRRAMNKFEMAGGRLFFDGGAGVKVETLQSVPEPKDFDAFWAKRKARLAKVPMRAEVKEHKSTDPKVRVLSFTVACAGPRPVTGTVTVPTDRSRKYPAQIHFHGYGKSYVQKIPETGPAECVDMYINAHGYELEREAEYYTEFYNSVMSNGRTFGIDSKWQNKSTDTAYFGWMIYRIMRALQYLKTRPEWDGKNIRVAGGSMGGLQSMWAAGLDPDVTLAEPSIPWNCDIGGRDTLKRIIDPWYIHETPALRYYDPVNLARRVNPKCRVEITRAGLGDYCCPPSGIWAMWNNLKCPKKCRWVQGSTHGHIPPEGMGNQEFVVEEN